MWVTVVTMQGTNNTKFIFCKGKGNAISLQVFYRPIGFQKVEATRFIDNRHTNVVRFSALCTGHLYSW